MLTINEASKLCYGTLSLSPLQSNYTLERKTELLIYAFNKGINFFDTAELYNNYDIFKSLLKQVKRSKIIISTKSYAYTKETAEASVYKALNEIGTNYIDIFMLHEQESIYTFRGHYEAYERLLQFKKDGVIRYLGISTHYCQAVEDLLTKPEINIIHPIFNYKGIGIVDGGIDRMNDAIFNAKRFGKKILGMKPLAGGHLSIDPIKSLKYAFDSPNLDWIAIGMRYEEEIDFNLSVLNNKNINLELKEKLKLKQRQLRIAEWCTGCGACIERCQQKALRLENGKSVVDVNKCVLCSYCASVCKDFCIKII